MTVPANPTRLRTVAAVLGGGVGTRVGLPTPKQFADLAGKPIIEHTVEALHACDVVDEIVIVIAADYTDQVAALLGDRYPKVRRIIAGGATRNESAQRALDAIEDGDCNVLLHDAVRPLLDRRIVEECVSALSTHAAVCVAIPSTDTIIEVSDDVLVASPDRDRLRRVQTPQGFRLSTIRAAYQLAWQDPTFVTSDDCSVVLKYLPDVPIRIVNGAEHNLKVTHAIDLLIAETLLQPRRTGLPD
jgi:2-C-methyl-D-erythritol 4-phosphate cytidylyltransferase